MSLFACFGSRKRETRSGSLVDYWDCSGLGLSDLPKEVIQHRRTLRQLTLSCNNIKDVPKTLFTFELLTELDLSENVILFLPPSIRSLRSLTTLNISKNSLSTIPDSIRECQDLLHLDISSNSLGSLPEGLTELRNLRTLALNDCQLEELPPNIGKLNKLETLELRENLINGLPQSVCHLTLLEKLDLGVNEMEAVAGVIGLLESLSELWLDGNLLNSLPDEIGSLRNLKFLEVSENQLMFLPLSVAALVSLQDLHLSDNLLTLLPETMGDMRNLKLLKVERNRLSALPQTMGGWSSLEELSVSHNFLEEIPPSIGALQHLETLIVDENSLFSLPPELGILSHLKILSLRGNNLVELPGEIGNLQNLCVLNLIGNKLQFLPFSVTSLSNLTAIWIAENQNRPLLDLQLTRSGEGQRMLTCILLPQSPPDSPFSEQTEEDLLPEHKPHATAVNFDPKVQDRKSKLSRDPTPYPKELHIKALQWRAAREEAGRMSPDRMGFSSNVPLRGSGRTRSLHRPYSLIRALSDPIDQDSVSPTNSHPNSRRSRERRDISRSPGLINSPPAVAEVRGGAGRRAERPRSGSRYSSPSPPPLLLPRNSYGQPEEGESYPPHEHGRRRGREEEYPARVLPNGKLVPVSSHNPLQNPPSSPAHHGYAASPGRDEHAALMANSNSSNGNWHSAVPAAKSSTFPLAQASCRYTPTPISPPVSPPKMYLQSNAQGQSETSTLSRSDVPDPRCSSSMESGFDADVELDPMSPWYVADSSPNHTGQKGQQKRRFASESSGQSYTKPAQQKGRRGSAGDYDHLRHNSGSGKKYYPKVSQSSSPLTNMGRYGASSHQHNVSRSFDNSEVSNNRQPVMKSEGQFVKPKAHQQVSYTAAAKGRNNGHARSRSQPEELVKMGTSMPAIAHRSAKGSQSPSHLASHRVKTNVSSQKPRRPSEPTENFSHPPPAQNYTPTSSQEKRPSLQDEVLLEDSVFQPQTHGQRNGVVSPSPQSPHSPSHAVTSPSTAANVKYHHHQHHYHHRHRHAAGGGGESGKGRECEKERERDGDGGRIAHQRYPSDSYYTSDDSQGMGAEHGRPTTPKTATKSYSGGGPAWATSQDSGFDSMKRSTPAPPPPPPPATTGNASDFGTIIRVELSREPSLGLGITGGTDGEDSGKPSDQGYRVYKIIDGSPAQRCGKIKIGDKILEINGVEVSSLDLPDILNLLEMETQISLTLFREPSMTLL